MNNWLNDTVTVIYTKWRSGSEIDQMIQWYSHNDIDQFAHVIISQNTSLMASSRQQHIAR